MAVNREKLNAQMDQYRNEKPDFGIRFVGKGVTRLRVLEFTDQDGDKQFARKLVQWQRPRGNDKPQPVGVDRENTFGLPDGYAKFQELAELKGWEFPFKRRRQWLVKAIDLNAPQKVVQTWALPNSVWEDISAYVNDDSWLDVLEFDRGHGFTIKGTGDNLGREYKTSVDRDPWPVPPDLQIDADPLLDVKDQGLVAQCAALGMSMQDLFGTDSVEGMDPVNAEPATAPSRPAPAAPARPAPPSRMAPAASPRPSGAIGPSRTAPNTPPAAPVAPAVTENKPKSLFGGLAGRR